MYGYESEISIKYNKSDLPVSGSKEISHDVKCTIKNYDEQIEITNNILYRISDYGQFMGEDIEDIDAWLKEQLDEICKRHLFNKSYLDIVFDKESPEADRVEQHIINEMHRKALTIGLEINQHFLLPALEPLVLKEDGLDIDIPKEYATKRSVIKIRVQLLLSAKIKDLRKVQGYIERQVDIKDRITKKSIKVIERKLHTIEPENALMFNSLSPWQAENEQTCEDILLDALREELKEFALDPLEITLKADESVLMQRIADLSRGTHVLDFTVHSKVVSEEQVEEVNFKVEYKINGVDPTRWATFHNDERKDQEGSTKEEELTAIEQTLENDLIGKLQTIPIEILRYSDFKTSQDMQQKIIEPAKLKIIETYGLMISFVNFLRTSTIWENIQLEDSRAEAESFGTNRKVLRENMAANKLAEIDALQSQRRELVKGNEDGDFDEQIKKTDKQIQEIAGEQPNFSKKKLLAGRKKTNEQFSFDDYQNNNFDSGKALKKSNENESSGETKDDDEKND